jgi:hypothetical protein
MCDKSLLIITSPYSWLEEFTSIDKWLGGKEINGKEVTTYQGLKELLKELGLKEIKEPEDLQYVIQENPWVYQYAKS